MQESGLTEIKPFICISAIWGQYPVFFTFPPPATPLFPPPTSQLLSAHCREQLKPYFSFLGVLLAQKFTYGVPEWLMTVASLFIDMVGNTPFLIT